MTRQLRASLLVVGLLATSLSVAAADDEASPEIEQSGESSEDADAERRERDSLYARVIVESTALRSGPGAGYRQTGIARRGEVFPVRQRATRGYWFQIERPDGTLAWIMGDAVYNADDPGESHFGSRALAPPPLPDAHVELTASFGALGGGGFFVVRPTIMVRPEFGVEVSGGIEVGSSGQLITLGVGGVLNIFPRSPIIPFMVVGGGMAFSDANADSFLQESGTLSMLYGGGGIRIAFKYRITLRFDVRAYVFFEADRYVSSEEYSGGLSVFF